MSEENYLTIIKENREKMKGYSSHDTGRDSDQSNKLPQPSYQKEYGESKRISLTKTFDNLVINNDFLSILTSRMSRRKYTDKALTLDELAFLLYATQGVKDIRGGATKSTLRTVPSAGCRHPFETYLFITNVEGLEPGLYHYLATSHELEYLGSVEDQENRVSNAFLGQSFLGSAPVGFVWTVIPYRSEWRYTVKAQKYSLLDAGHVAQNLYLACEAIGCGTCAIAAYEQEPADHLLGLSSKPSSDTDNEFVIYAASVGKI
jgi:SagB-type dehydrogenase family enzyme